MESTSVPAAVEPVSPAAEQPGAEPAAAPAPALILLESADDAGVCDVNGMCL